jgi:glutamate racemase
LIQALSGISIWKEIHNLLPNETIYLADSKNAPYGQNQKRRDHRLEYEKIPTYCLNELQTHCSCLQYRYHKCYSRIKINMTFFYRNRTYKTCCHEFKTRKIGILATQGTLISELFNKTAQQFKNTKIIDQVWISAAYRKGKCIRQK